ncbi:FHA domain-containing protein [Aureibacter tunicatorum]|uniref:FHA domain-containing protein n=1 Tax=Aureibacter tunicatorum TaxID=866807 RepID=A0AAE4BSM2_9BACT|nr:FHA domain-containing protein [Aureibacter tunicatorum]MDR6239005.1 hypothetical protein [Aureibacter tunicatorum]BDD05069.1 hypothetical protein AUTU_25520 [Aureibacter tunicatorum]
MAFIKNQKTGKKHVLNYQHAIGRSKSNHLYIPLLDISRLHATIFWQLGRWFLKDHSRNGTLVDFHLIHHSVCALNKDSLIQFGGNDDTVWELCDSERPTSYILSNEDDDSFYDLGEGMLFPDSENPVCSFFRSKNSKWMLDNGDMTFEIAHKQILKIGGKEWLFFENDPLNETVVNVEIFGSILFFFKLSTDEENVDLKLRYNEWVCDLGDRVHNHLLLVLARKREKDKLKKLRVEEQGWIKNEELTVLLTKELQKDVDIYYLNILVYRIRRQLARIKPYGHILSEIIERKKGKIRIKEISYFEGKDDAWSQEFVSTKVQLISE